MWVVVDKSGHWWGGHELRWTGDIEREFKFRYRDVAEMFEIMFDARRTVPELTAPPLSRH